MSIDRVINMYSGFHHEGEIRMLNRISASVDDGVIVSIGSYRGQMDCALALHAHVPVYAIDNREGSVGEAFLFSDEDRTVWMENVLSMGLGAKIRPINLSSTEVTYVWYRPIGLLFIDASHDYLSVLNDLGNWVPFVVAGGLVALHDVTNPDTPGVAQAIADFGDDLELIEQADLTCVYRKHSDFSIIEKSSYIKSVKGVDAEPDVPLVGTTITAFSTIDGDYVVATAEPRHPSRRSKAPAKKPTARKPAKKVVKRK